ncbi:PAS domain S-box protein [Kiritimatiellota bacterium B12222]|nr:PAS domain S-box protein [Kiritimatiellota bacterium B12222]
MNLFQILTPLTYWILVGLWLYILGFLFLRLRRSNFEKSLPNILIIVLGIDALRTVLESIFFGSWFTSKSGFLPISVYDFLVRPEIVIIPKILNVITALLIIGILLYRWFPAEKRDRELQERNLQKRTRQLKESEERFRMICEYAPVLIDSFDEAGKCIVWNKQCEKTFGWTMDEINAHENSLALFYPDPTVYKEVEAATMRDPDGCFKEWHPQTKDNRTVTINWASFRLPSGTIISMGHDITERKRDQAQLVLMNDALENSLNAFDIVNAEGVFTYVNQSYITLWGYENADEIVGTPASAHCQDPTFPQKIIKELYANGKYEGELTAKRKDGSIFEALIYARLAHDSNGEAIFPTTFIEITSLKQAQQEVLKEKNRLQFALEVCQTGAWDLDLVTLSAHRTIGHDRIFGYETKAPEWHYKNFLSHVVPEDKEEVDRKFQYSFSNHSDWNIECRIRRTDGEIRWIWAVGRHASPVDGKVRYMGGVVQDITERKLNELEVQKAHDLLEIRVEERTAELKIRQQEAEDLNRAMINMLEDLKQTNQGLEVAKTALRSTNQELEAFSYSVSHDLRAPLRAINGFVQILHEDYGEHLDDEGQRVCKVISDSAQDMGRLIDDLLAFSRVGRATLQSQAIDMEELAQITFTEICSPEEQQRIDFHLDPLPKALGDQALMRHIWMNLLGNAVKFSSKQEKAVISVRAQQKQDEVIYAVHDNGAGFDAQYADKLFGVFQRLHRSDEFEGTGVGLAIVQRIINRHGGRIWAEGKPNQGATFYFTMKTGEDLCSKLKS